MQAVTVVGSARYVTWANANDLDHRARAHPTYFLVHLGEHLLIGVDRFAKVVHQRWSAALAFDHHPS
jgi:hypothetical protein